LDGQDAHPTFFSYQLLQLSAFQAVSDIFGRAECPSHFFQLSAFTVVEQPSRLLLIFLDGQDAHPTFSVNRINSSSLFPAIYELHINLPKKSYELYMNFWGCIFLLVFSILVITQKKIETLITDD